MENLGHKVNKVALAFILLGGETRWDAHYCWKLFKKNSSESIERLADSKVLSRQLDPEANPEHWNLIPATTSRNCLYCPFFLPGSMDLSKGCPGTGDLSWVQPMNSDA
jgi:hypothetical protein